MKRLGRALVGFLRTPNGMRALWLLGTVAILAAVGMTGEIGLLTFVFERELLALVAESAFLYAMYSWRTGSVALGWAVARKAVFWHVARANALAMRWAC